MKKMDKFWIKIISMAFIILTIGSFLAYIPFVKYEFTLKINEYEFYSTSDGNGFKATYRVRSGDLPMDLQIVAIPVVKMPIDKEVFLYFDERYPHLLFNMAGWISIVNRVIVELKLRGYNAPIKIVNATQLREIMMNNYGCVIVILCGVFPDTVYDPFRDVNLVKPWLYLGGTLIWAGDVFAFYSGHIGVELDYKSPDQPKWEGEKMMLGYSLLYRSVDPEPEYRFAITKSKLSEALDLRYNDLWVGCIISELLKHNGLILGDVGGAWGEERTSIGGVPVGQGYLIIFGGGYYGSPLGKFIGRDIAQILYSEILSSSDFADFEIAYNDHQLERRSLEEGSINMTFHNEASISGIVITVFSKNPDVHIYTRKYYSK